MSSSSIPKYEAFDSGQLPDECDPYLFYVNHHLFASHGACGAMPGIRSAVTKIHAGEGDKDGSEISRIDQLSSDDDFDRLVIIAESRGRLHLRLGENALLENVMLTRAKDNGGLPRERFFVENILWETRKRVWEYEEHVDGTPVDRALSDVRIHGKIWYLEGSDTIVFEDHAGSESSDLGVTRFLNLRQDITGA